MCGARQDGNSPYQRASTLVDPDRLTPCRILHARHAKTVPGGHYAPRPMLRYISCHDGVIWTATRCAMAPVMAPQMGLRWATGPSVASPPSRRLPQLTRLSRALASVAEVQLPIPQPGSRRETGLQHSVRSHSVTCCWVTSTTVYRTPTTADSPCPADRGQTHPRFSCTRRVPTQSNNVCGLRQEQVITGMV